MSKPKISYDEMMNNQRLSAFGETQVITTQKTKNLYEDAETAFLRFSQLLRQNGLSVMQVVAKHRSRHRLIITPKIDFYCLFRKADTGKGTFEKFNDYFTGFVLEFPQYRGHAETINEEIINKICQEKYYSKCSEYKKDLVMIYIYHDTNKYICNPFLFKRFAEKYNLIRKHNATDHIRTQEGKSAEIHEITYHLPFCRPFFVNFNEWIQQRKEDEK